MPSAQPSGFAAVANASLPPKPKLKRPYTTRTDPKPTPQTDFIGYLDTLPIRELPGVVAQCEALVDACPEGTALYEQVEHQRHLARTTVWLRQPETEDAALADRFERIRSGQEPLIRPGQTQELPADTLRRTLRQAALTTDWTEAQKQGNEPHPFLLALLQHDPTELVDVLREAFVAYWATYLGRYWRSHRHAPARDCGDQLLFQPWRGPSESAFRNAITAWLHDHPDALHPGWTSPPRSPQQRHMDELLINPAIRPGHPAVDELLSRSFVNPGYRLTVAEALAKEHEITHAIGSTSSPSQRETPSCPSDLTLAARRAYEFDISIDPLSMPEWVVPAECGIWRSPEWRDAGTFGIDFSETNWGIHRRRQRRLGRLTKFEIERAQGGAIALLKLIAPDRFPPKPNLGKPKGAKDKKFHPRGPRGNSPEDFARYEAGLRRRELKARYPELRAQILREAEEQGIDPRVALHQAFLEGRIHAVPGRRRIHTEPQPKPPSSRHSSARTSLHTAASAAMAMAPHPGFGPDPVAWTPEELDGSAPHPLIRILLDPSIPEEVVLDLCATRDVAFRHNRKGQGFGGQWLSSPHYDPDWAAKCAERWWPADEEIWFAAPGSPGALEEASRGRVALVGAGAGKGPLQRQLEALEAQHKELMRELEDEDHYWDPGKESREELDERLDAMEAQADHLRDEMDAIRGQAEEEASQAIGGERERFERLLAPFAWLDPNYCRALRAALEEAQSRKALKGSRIRYPENRLPMA